MQGAPQHGPLGMKLRTVRKRARSGLRAHAHDRCHAHQCLSDEPTRKRGSTAKYNRSTIKLIMTKTHAIKQR